MSQSGIYNIYLQADHERLWCLLFARSEEDAIIRSCKALDNDFFLVNIKLRHWNWLSIQTPSSSPPFHLGDSLTKNFAYVETEKQVESDILSRSAVTGEAMHYSTDIWFSSCINHHDADTIGANYYMDFGGHSYIDVIHRCLETNVFHMDARMNTDKILVKAAKVSLAMNDAPYILQREIF